MINNKGVCKLDDKDNKLWLFDYNQGIKYEEFSKCQDINNKIKIFLQNHFEFKDKVILEIGSGSGKFTSMLADKCLKLYVVEKSISLMQINRIKNASANNIDFMHIDARNLVLNSNSIDIIFAGWCLTSIRDSFDIMFKIFKDVLKKDGVIILIENAGNDEFCKIMEIEEFTNKMREKYIDMRFTEKEILSTTIQLPNKNVFYNAFPNKNNANITSLNINHNVLILQMEASKL